MSLLPRRALIPAALALALLPALSAHAQQKVTVGTIDGANAFPFGSTPPGDYAAGGEYQEIYSSDNFSGPVVINSIAFASASGFGTGPATYDVTIGYSNTSATAGPNSNASNVFSANKGANFTTVFSGQVTANLLGNDTFDLVFPTAPFLFDPAGSNLLFDVVLNQATQSDIFVGFDKGGQTRVYSPSGSGGTTAGIVDNRGLYTQFDVTPAAVPEASTTLSFALLIALDSGSLVAAKRKSMRGSKIRQAA